MVSKRAPGRYAKVERSKEPRTWVSADPGDDRLGWQGLPRRRALSLVIGAVLIGRLIRNFPLSAPEPTAGLVLYELSRVWSSLAIGTAVIITRDSGPRRRSRLYLDVCS
jgi:hypothetical protein